jgi:hypothetical protein
MMAKSKKLSNDIIDFLIEENKEKEPEIREFCGVWGRYLESLDCIFSKLRMPHGTPTENDITILADAVENAMKLAEELDLSYTPCLHFIHMRAVPMFRQHARFGELLEDSIEQSHQTMDRLHRRHAGLGSCAKIAKSISACLKRAETCSVKQAADVVHQQSNRCLRNGTAAQRNAEAKDECDGGS